MSRMERRYVGEKYSEFYEDVLEEEDKHGRGIWNTVVEMFSPGEVGMIDMRVFRVMNNWYNEKN